MEARVSLVDLFLMLEFIFWESGCTARERKERRGDMVMGQSKIRGIIDERDQSSNQCWNNGRDHHHHIQLEE